jgi:hypothetical protein
MFSGDLMSHTRLVAARPETVRDSACGDAPEASPILSIHPFYSILTELRLNVSHNGY